MDSSVAGTHVATTPIGRREFVRVAAAGCGAFLAGGAGVPRGFGGCGQDALGIGLVTSGAADCALARGVTMGVEEAARTGGLMGRTAVLRTADSVDAAAALARGGQVAALIGGWDAASCRALAEVAESAGILFLNAGCRAEALAGSACGANVFHVEASERMIAAALAARPADAGDDVRVALWHPSLERFGAAQLNDRFRARWGGGEMDGAAWAGWMAVKAVWEASLRARSTAPDVIRGYLSRESTQFDGHKGWPLSFRAWDHQLRQPLYLVSADGARVVAEVPVRPAEGEASSRDLLDALAGERSQSTCTSTERGAR